MSKDEITRLQEFENELREKKEPEEKAECSLTYMREFLSQGSSPRLKEFWEAKNHCMIAFKEKMNPVKRKALWDEYLELTGEAKRLKTILDEQSSFNVEQIELALTSLGAEIELLDQSIEKFPELALSPHLKKLIRNADELSHMHRELGALNAHAAKLNALRKEIIKTDMRIKHKNRLLKTIADYSDKVFPRRRDLIKNTSDEFLIAVEAFAAGKLKDKAMPFHLKEDIRGLQGLSKELSLSSPVFKRARDILSDAWENVKIKEKEIAEHNAAMHEVHTAAYEALLPSAQAFGENPSSYEQGESLKKQVREATLSRYHSKELSVHIEAGLSILREKQQSLKYEARMQKEKALKALLQELSSARPLTLEEVDDYEQRAEETALSLALSEVERMKISFLLLKMRAQVVLSLGNEELIPDLRKNVKRQLDSYRKEAGSSALDFERAMQLRECTDECRRLLEKVDSYA